MAHSVSYFEAVSLWWNSDPNLREMTMGGLPILWWGRIGKTAVLLASFTLVLDIIGEKRLREFSNHLAMSPTWRRLGRVVVYLTVGAALAFVIILAPGELPWYGFPILAASLSLTAWVVGLLGRLAGRGLLWILQKDKLAALTRVVSLVLLVSGFQFDMLAS